MAGKTRRDAGRSSPGMSESTSKWIPAFAGMTEKGGGVPSARRRAHKRKRADPVGPDPRARVRPPAALGKTSSTAAAASGMRARLLLHGQGHRDRESLVRQIVVVDADVGRVRVGRETRRIERH